MSTWARGKTNVAWLHGETSTGLHKLLRALIKHGALWASSDYLLHAGEGLRVGLEFGSNKLLGFYKGCAKEFGGRAQTH